MWAILRFIVIILAVMTTGSLGMLAAYFWKPETYGTGELWTVLLIIFGLIGSGIASFDYITFQEEGVSTVIISTSGVTTFGEVDFGVYWDVTATDPVREIAWGQLEPDSTGSVEFWVRSREANLDLYAKIAWTEDSWDPPGAYVYFDLTWDFGETPLRPGMGRKVKVDLYVHPDIQEIEDFRFNIVITGDDQPFSSILGEIPA